MLEPIEALGHERTAAKGCERLGPIEPESLALPGGDEDRPAGVGALFW
jgi:hypothetical protein